MGNIRPDETGTIDSRFSAQLRELDPVIFNYSYSQQSVS